MTKIYTKSGDDGFTGLYGGSRVRKNSLIVKCYGTIDEVIASLGLAYATTNNLEIKNQIRQVQVQLSTLAAEFSSDENGLSKLEKFINEDDILALELGIDKIYQVIDVQSDFIIPGANLTSAQLHLARTICRRFERLLIDLEEEESIREETLIYVNRLSDYLFALARYEEHLEANK